MRRRSARWVVVGAAVVVVGAGAAAVAHHHEHEGHGDGRAWAAGDRQQGEGDGEGSRHGAGHGHGHGGNGARHGGGAQQGDAQQGDVQRGGAARQGAPAPLPSADAGTAVSKAAAAVSGGKVESLTAVAQQGGGSAWQAVVLGPDGVRHLVTVDGAGTSVTGNTVLDH
ncbi:hypothetical protein VM98_30015 [Streptomyces rubellomurinus subsp. indigoferus]|nr:hypothetical protein VM98_30015 [Streptomyces rubellomurinus subsp. indigoferus]